CQVPTIVDNILAKKAKQYMMYSRFMVGTKPNLEDNIKIRRITRILKYNTCLLGIEQEEIDCVLNRILNGL
ncbi:hypothetical protein ABK046_51550, partial [Streptomyces caeruleatus]